MKDSKLSQELVAARKGDLDAQMARHESLQAQLNAAEAERVSTAGPPCSVGMHSARSTSQLCCLSLPLCPKPQEQLTLDLAQYNADHAQAQVTALQHQRTLAKLRAEQEAEAPLTM
jgi:hypothetical protein